MPADSTDGSYAIEYTLSRADCHALDLFVFDTVLRKQLRVRLKFYGTNGLVGAFYSILCGLFVGGAAMALTRTMGFWELTIGCLAALVIFAVGLIGFLPGGYYHKTVRRRNEKRFWSHRLRLQEMGIQKSQQNCRVVLTPEGFTEALDSHEASDAIEISESKLTRVSWLAVSSIEATDHYAFFTIENANFSFKKPGYLILPRLAFDTETSFRAFVNTAVSYREAAYQAATTSLGSRKALDSRITR